MERSPGKARRLEPTIRYRNCKQQRSRLTPRGCLKRARKLLAQEMMAPGKMVESADETRVQPHRPRIVRRTEATRDGNTMRFVALGLAGLSVKSSALSDISNRPSVVRGLRAKVNFHSRRPTMPRSSVNSFTMGVAMSPRGGRFSVNFLACFLAGYRQELNSTCVARETLRILASLRSYCPDCEGSFLRGPITFRLGSLARRDA